jgi:hypothetical protein
MAGTALNTTTLSSALTKTASTAYFASVSNVNSPVSNFYQQAYIVGPGGGPGELVDIVGNNSTAVQLSRLDQYRAHWPSGSLVILGPEPTSAVGYGGFILSPVFNTYDPVGANATSNSTGAGSVIYTPWINVTTGRMWIWSDVLVCWVPGWNNPGPFAVTDAVASAAGEVTPSGPLFHITGSSAITGFNTPEAFPGFGSFTVIPDGTFTWTTANNIALAGTAVVNKAIVFTWDGTNSKWVPSVVS